MTDYTPTTEEIRTWLEDENLIAEFDRWLAERDRKVKAKAWEEGEQAGIDNQLNWTGWAYAKGFEEIANPYRQGENK